MVPVTPPQWFVNNYVGGSSMLCSVKNVPVVKDRERRRGLDVSRRYCSPQESFFIGESIMGNPTAPHTFLCNAAVAVFVYAYRYACIAFYAHELAVLYLGEATVLPPVPAIFS